MGIIFWLRKEAISLGLLRCTWKRTSNDAIEKAEAAGNDKIPLPIFIPTIIFFKNLINILIISENIF